MSLVKYRLKEVAADFGVAPKVIADIISKYFQKPKSNTQVLTDEELNLVFDSMTQTHQIASLEQVFAVKPAPKAEPPKPEAPKAEAPKQEAQQAAKPQQAKPQSQPQNQNRPQQPAAPSAQDSSAMQPRDSLVANFITVSSYQIAALQRHLHPILTARQIVLNRNDSVLSAAGGKAVGCAVRADAICRVVDFAVFH